jgi:hypothetical protein
MIQTNSFWFRISSMLIMLLASGCGLIAPAASSLPVSRPTDTPGIPTPKPLTPTATTYIFELKPSSTPIPTRTPFASLEYDPGLGPSNFPPGANPLTGLTVSDPALLERRPMAIKVTNFPRSVRPQYGLTLADHVYEYYLENFITRFIGVFYGNDASRVGPVRSGRFFDEHIARMYKAIFVFAYADDRVVDPWSESDLRNLLVVEREDNCPPLCRIGSKHNYNTLFADTAGVAQYIRERGTANDRQNLDGLRFESNPPFTSQAGEKISIQYSFVSYNLWEYDPTAQRYLRYQEAEDENGEQVQYAPLTDSLTGQPIAADNLVVLLIPHQYYIHTNTTEMVMMDFLGQGNAYAFRDGKVYPLVWQRETAESLVTLIMSNGRPYPLKPGNTWYQVLGQSTEIRQSGIGELHFDFAIP